MLVRVAAAAALSALTVTPAAAEDWVLRRSTSGGTCWVMKATASPVGTELSRFPTKKQACEDAKARYEAATTETSKCGGYSAGTVAECRAAGVPLPQ